MIVVKKRQRKAVVELVEAEESDKIITTVPVSSVRGHTYRSKFLILSIICWVLQNLQFQERTG